MKFRDLVAAGVLLSAIALPASAYTSNTSGTTQNGMVEALTDIVTDLGAPGATACATDTGSCNLNALIQRVAQRLTSLINAGVASSVTVTSSVLPTGAAADASLQSILSKLIAAPATEAKQDTIITDLGAPGSTACATDTGSCNQNALIQRVAQRLTSLITAVGSPLQAGGNVAVTNLPTTVDTNSGNKSASTLRSVEATDAPAVANKGQGATGAAPPSGAVQLGAAASGATGGLLAGLKGCDLHAKYDASDNGSITLVTGVASRKIYVCGYVLATGGTATNLKLREGSDANCATNAADLTPAYQLPANSQTGALSSFWTGLATSTNAYYVCINASAGNAHQGELWYSIQ